jgi:glycosyltransferase involved in cell wall biosynthesis
MNYASNESGLRVGYVVKRYPRFSETFIVNEVLAHEAAGLDVEIFSVRPCNDVRFQERISQVQAPVTRLPAGSPKGSVLLDAIRRGAKTCPNIWSAIENSQHVDAITIHQAIRLAEAVRDRNISHLHAHFATLPAAVARLAAQIAGISYSLTAHAKDIFHESVDNEELRQKFADAAAVITVSEFNRKHLIEEYRLPDQSVHRVYNGLDLAHLPFEPTLPRQRHILGVGRLVPKKGFDDLIRACAILQKSGTDFSCTIIGDGELREPLQRLIDSHDLNHVVQMVGPQPQEQVKALLRISAIHAAPCVVSGDGDRDGLPTVLLEAMATGTPCVSTAVTGIPEVIHPMQTGLMAQQNDPASLADAMARLLDDAELQNTIAFNARRLIESHFDCSKTSGQIRNIFRQSVTETSASVLQESA